MAAWADCHAGYLVDYVQAPSHSYLRCLCRTALTGSAGHGTDIAAHPRHICLLGVSIPLALECTAFTFVCHSHCMCVGVAGMQSTASLKQHRPPLRTRCFCSLFVSLARSVLLGSVRAGSVQFGAFLFGHVLSFLLLALPRLVPPPPLPLSSLSFHVLCCVAVFCFCSVKLCFVRCCPPSLCGVL